MGYNKTIVITGTSTGIGKAFALHFIKMGFRVFAGVRKQADGDNLKKEASERLTPIILDVTDENSISKAASVIEKETGGNVFGLMLGMLAAWHRGRWLDKLVMSTSVVGMSVSFLVIIIGLQILLCTPYGLNLFPVRGWQVHDLPSYLYYVTVPTLALLLVTLGYNTRFYRAVMVDEIERDHIRTLQAYGASPIELLFKHVLKNSLIPVITRIMFSVPFVVVSGSLLLESYFGIPGIGLVTFNAITSGDQPILKAVVSLTGVLFVLALMINDMLYSVVDPRVTYT